MRYYVHARREDNWLARLYVYHDDGNIVIYEGTMGECCAMMRELERAAT